VIRDMLAFKDAPYLSASIMGSIPKVTMPSGSDLTLTLGEFVSMSLATAHGSAGGGVYFWWRPREFGLYGGFSVGMVSQVSGIGGGGQVCILFGPAPVFLAGRSLVLGVDITVAGMPIVVGGFLVLSTSRELRGIGWDVGAGEGLFPVEISLSVSVTATRAVGHV
jgi:hypothetical protein